jgi:hypothetical protein
MSLYQRNYEGEHAPAQAPVPANYLKPKVFIGGTSIRQFRAPAEKFAALRAGAERNSPVRKGEAQTACRFGSAISCCAEASVRRSIDAKIIL